MQQEIEGTSEGRPHRPSRVVPFEPSLRYRYYRFISGALALCCFSINLHFIFGTALWNTSFLGFGAMYYGIYALLPISFFSRSGWQELEKRRQQAARYNLAVNLKERVDRSGEHGESEWPVVFVLAARRRWLATCIVAGVDSLFLGLIGSFVYSSWQTNFQAFQQGIPLVVVVLNNYGNLVVVLFLAVMLALYLLSSPRTRIIATRDGLACRRGYRTSYIPWQQARLFAIIGQSDPRNRQAVVFYELASKDTVIRWPSTGGPRGLAVPGALASFAGLMVRPEAKRAFPQQVQVLNSMIADYTRLPLYDLR